MMVEGCNDSDVAYWIPTIRIRTRPSMRSRSFAGVLADEDAMAIELGGRVVGGIGIGLNSNQYRARIGYWIAAPERGKGICTCASALSPGTPSPRTSSTTRSDHGSGQCCLATGGGEGRLPA